MSEKIYYPELDGLRFIAFLTVFIHHSAPIPWMPGNLFLVSRGWAGVDLFLCLSAFLFVHLLKIEWQRTGGINIVNFYMRRTLRIWPAYFFFVSIIVFFVYSAVGHSDTRMLRFYGLFTFTDNILDAVLGYNMIAMVGHLWTISYEEQFYAVIPWFLRFMFAQIKKIQLLILAAIFLIFTAIRAAFILFQVPHPAVWVLPITHFEAILFGLAIGLGGFDWLLKRAPWWLTGAAGTALLLATRWVPNVFTMSWGLMALYPMVGLGVALLVCMALQVRDVPIMRWLTWRPLVYLGKISYGLYLYHLAGLTIMSVIMEKLAAVQVVFNSDVQPLVYFLIGIAVTITIASVSYEFLEKPFLRMKSRFTVVQSRPA